MFFKYHKKPYYSELLLSTILIIISLVFTPIFTEELVAKHNIKIVEKLTKTTNNQHVFQSNHVDKILDTEAKNKEPNHQFSIIQNPDPIDSDGDGIDDFTDLDNDNDGILNQFECGQVQSNAFNVVDGYSEVFTLPSADGGFVIDFSSIDNSFNLVINGVNLVPDELQFELAALVNAESFVLFASDNTAFGENDNSQIYQMNQFNANPNVVIIRLTINPNGSIALQGKRTLTSPLEDLIIEATDPQFNAIAWNANGSNTVQVSQKIFGTTFLYARGFGLDCSDDIDGDGISNDLDLDSDGDGCLDVVESGGVDANNDGILDGQGIDSDGLVTGGSGGYDEITGNEFIAHQSAISSTPIDQTAIEGNSTFFSVEAIADEATSYNNGTSVFETSGNANSGLEYQWFLGDPDTNGTPLTDTTIYSGTTSSTLTINDVAGLDASTYCVIVTHEDFECFEEVACAQLTTISACITASGNIDTDGDGITDVCDIDDDNDGILDSSESENQDQDNDGIPNRLDIDSDNDGIPDNVEAQSTLDYIAPSGISANIVDVDRDGLDDNYDDDITSNSSETSLGIIPENTDAEDNPDFLDTDSDNDNILDIEENGSATSISTPFSDNDADGLDDVFDTVIGYDVNDNFTTPSLDLPDCDNDVDTGGNVDYRDAPTIPSFNVPSSICEGDLINLPAISVNEVTGNWSPEINTNETTTYTFTPNPNQCALLTELTISVEPINIISLNATIISDLFTETLSIELNVIGGNGDYEYKIDNAAWQSSTIFEDLENEIVYTFSARQINGCSNIAVASAQGLSFPTFFTPNGDGFNDYCNIRSLKNQQNAVIHIFDRYGKLLVELNPSQIGWDGIYNGKPLPSNDYWFNVKFTDPRTGNLVNYVNHFTLRR